MEGRKENLSEQKLDVLIDETYRAMKRRAEGRATLRNGIG